MNPHGIDLIVNQTAELLVSFESFTFYSTFKMFKNLFLIVGKFIVTLSVLVPTNYCILNMNIEGQLTPTVKDFKESDTELIKEVKENNTFSTINETLFWALPDTKNTTEPVLDETDVYDVQGVQVQDVKPENEQFLTEENIKEESTDSTTAITEPSTSAGDITSEEKNHEIFPQESNYFSHEKIILSRENCLAEIAVHENNDIKLTIKFEHLQNNSHGRCCLTLSGRKNSMLGVLISNVHLYQNNTQGEVLKVIVGDYRSAFTLKEYYGTNDYEPLLLTETHKVYLVLYYKVQYVAPNEDCTYFNLEVFTYHKAENSIHHYNEHKEQYNHFHA